MLGVLVGAPLGVCANCAAPIGKAIYDAGGRVETMLAAMVSSPTLNVIVLSMVLALFPLYMGLIKIGLTVGFLCVGIPLLARLVPLPTVIAVNEESRHGPRGPTPSQPAVPFPLRESWGQSAWWVVRHFGGNLWRLVRTTVPLMLLAGLLGSIVITLLPLESLTTLLPTVGRRKLLLGMGGVAVLGVFLPVPMAFDVIVTAILWQAGLPVSYTMVLLFTLGIFSIYPYTILWQTLNLRLATSISVALIGLGIVAGVLGQRYALWDFQRQQQFVFQALHDSATALHGPHVLRVGGTTREVQPDGALVAALQSTALVPQGLPLLSQDGITVERLPWQAPSGQATVPGQLFQRVEGRQLGLDEPYSFSILKLTGPFTQFRGIASGDVHNDGWMDLLLTADEVGLSLYANRQGQGFVLQPLDVPGLHEWHVVNAALVDLNNDGWLDIFFSTYRQGNYVLYNTGGRFTAEHLHQLPAPPDAVMTGAAAFGDVDKDGTLDLVLGSWAPVYHGGSAVTANKVVVRQKEGRWQVHPVTEARGATLLLQSHGKGRDAHVQPLTTVPGPTLSRQTLNILLSDINHDGNLDLIIGNEDLAADTYALGTGDGHFRLVTRQEGLLPYTTATTMSVASADINNDLRPEIYLGQISGVAASRQSRDVSPALCDELAHPAETQSCRTMVQIQRQLPQSVRKAQTALDARQCLARAPQGYREDCIAYALYLWTLHRGTPQLCDLFPDRWEPLRFVCRLGYAERTQERARLVQTPTRSGVSHPEGDEAMPVLLSHNVLLMPTSAGHFVDMAAVMGVQQAGFTWNAKFADVDNDEFVDLYAVNGWLPSPLRESHVFYHNQHGKTFVEQTHAVGLGSFLPTSAYTYVDLDNDGDLDIVAVPIAGPVLVYINTSTNNRIALALHDQHGNRFGIGSTLIIHYGPDGARHQMRELQASGGFLSFDAPVAYFGLGAFPHITRVDIHWSTGERSVIQGDLPAGARYIIHRQPLSPAP